MKYFISYTIRDKEITKEFLDILSQKLFFLGSLFIDLIDNNSQNKQERVITELDYCDVLILVESRNVYNQNGLVLNLREQKVDRFRLKLYPLKIL